MAETRIRLIDILQKLSLNEKKMEDLCLLLPDSLDQAKCKNHHASLQNELFRDDMKQLLRGNLRGEKAFYVANGTKDLRVHLQKNERIDYDDGRPSVRAVDNMLAKLYFLVCREKITAEASVFVTYRNLAYWYDNDEIYKAYERCLDKGSDEALAYALFYLVLAAIFHYHTYEFFGFYAKERLDRILGEEKSAEDGVLSDAQYLNIYQVFCPRTSYSDIQYEGELDLSQKGFAILRLSDDKGAYHRKYSGIPWYNEIERLVYFIGHSEKHRVCILVFRYEPFDNQPMFYRRAFLVTLNRDEKEPEIRKAVICKDCPVELDVIRGMLRMHNANFTITQDAVDEFLKEIEKYDWYAKNESAIQRFLAEKKQELYYLNEREIFNNNSLVLPDVERMRMIKILASKSMSEDSISLKDLPKIHKLMNVKKES